MPHNDNDSIEVLPGPMLALPDHAQSYKPMPLLCRRVSSQSSGPGSILSVSESIPNGANLTKTYAKVTWWSSGRMAWSPLNGHTPRNMSHLKQRVVSTSDYYCHAMNIDLLETFNQFMLRLCYSNLYDARSWPVS